MKKKKIWLLAKNVHTRGVLSSQQVLGLAYAMLDYTRARAFRLSAPVNTKPMNITGPQNALFLGREKL